MARAKQSKRNLPPPPPHRLTSIFDDPPRKNVLLLSCMDQRLLDDIVRFMNGLNLHNRYDQLALAGGAMGALKLPDPKLSDKERWQEVFFIHLHSAINVLHRPIKDVFLLDHLDCGAYRYLHPIDQVKEQYSVADRDEMIALHRQELSEFARVVAAYIDKQRELAEDELNAARKACGGHETESKCWEQVEKLAKEKIEAWTDIRVSCLVMDLLGEVIQLDVPAGQRSTLER